MIKILHGENLVESRKALSLLLEKARSEGTEVVILPASKLTLDVARNTLGSDSLLSKTRLLVIENLLSEQKSKEKNKILDFLESGKFDNDLVLWEEKEIKKTPALVDAQAVVFKISPFLFRFLESLRPDNHQEMLNLLTKVRQQEEPEMIFYMLIRQFRYLIMAKDRALVGIPDWQCRKLETQARHFEPEKLKNIYRQLLEIDFTQKTSGDPYTLSSRLDLFISSL